HLARIRRDVAPERLPYPSQREEWVRVIEDLRVVERGVWPLGGTTDSDDQVVFAWKVPVDETGADVGLGRDVLHRGPVEPAPDEDAGRGLQDLPAARLQVVVRYFRHGAPIDVGWAGSNWDRRA